MHVHEHVFFIQMVHTAGHTAEIFPLSRPHMKEKVCLVIITLLPMLVAERCSKAKDIPVICP